MPTLPPPSSIMELKQRANALAGQTLQELAQQVQETVPLSLTHAKGWIGQLIEKALGAHAYNLDQPDFINLGIELKTLPIASSGLPCESTYLCAASLPFTESNWEDSRVWRKIAHVLWVPIEANPQRPLPSQRIGLPILWSPSPIIVKQLREDWEELTELMKLGKFENLSAHLGTFLQIRPKAPHAKTFIQVFNHLGQKISIGPKGFYLRTKLTQQIVQEHYVWA